MCSCSLLETLSLKRSGISSAILSCPLLRELDVSSCHKLSDPGVRGAAISCPLLQSLDISNCSYVSDDTLREIAAACTDLRFLDASHCPNISLEVVSGSSKASAHKSCQLPQVSKFYV
jgi:hypothetical protein